MTWLPRAIHETGHAPLAFEMGIGVQYVTITEANGRARQGWSTYFEPLPLLCFRR